jgi:hypothetical protein
MLTVQVYSQPMEEGDIMRWLQRNPQGDRVKLVSPDDFSLTIVVIKIFKIKDVAAAIKVMHGFYKDPLIHGKVQVMHCTL